MASNLDLERTQVYKYGRSVIEFKLGFEERKNLAITVRPDKSVVLRAPVGASQQAIREKLEKRGKWILKQINYFDKFHPIQPARQYVPGETHCYLGRKYRLRVRKGRDESVLLSGRYFAIRTMKPKDRTRLKLLMLDWYATHAQTFLDQRMRKYSAELLEAGSKEIVVKYGVMKTRWGSCLGDNSLKLNVELIKTPLPCIDYVVVHELCHLIHPNHDKQFYRLLDRTIPDWRDRKAKLEAFNTG